MKKHGILNRHLAGALAELGHGDGVLVCDAGMPIPDGPRVVDLAFRAGVPSFAEVLEGLLEELVVEGGTGLAFEPGNATELAARVREVATDASLSAHLRRGARRQYEAKYTAERNYSDLLGLYGRVLNASARAASAAPPERPAVLAETRVP